MSLRVTLCCDGHRHGARCRNERVTGCGYSPSLRSDDPDRPLVTPGLLDGWRIGDAPHGGDLCPAVDHDEDRPQPIRRETLEEALENDRCGICGSVDHFREDHPADLAPDCPECHEPPGQHLVVCSRVDDDPHLIHARRTLADRTANEGLT